MNYIITGGTGFIGTHLTNLIKEHDKNAQVWNLDIVDPNKLDGLNEELRMKKQRSAAEGKANEEYLCQPWMICKPNEKEGKYLLAEIMQGGNFGQYDTRDAALKKGGMMKHGLWKLKRVMRLVSSYPEEAMWEPVFRVWHLFWRGIHG